MGKGLSRRDPFLWPDGKPMSKEWREAFEAGAKTIADAVDQSLLDEMTQRYINRDPSFPSKSIP